MQALDVVERSDELEVAGLAAQSSWQAVVDQAKAFRQRLVDSGALDRAGVKVKTGPIVAEVAETVTY